MNPMLLTLERIVSFWRKVWKGWRLVLDWTVLLYIVLPALWIGGGIYTESMRQPPPWVDMIPATTPILVLAVTLLRGRLRTFAEPGDGLFLRNNRSWTARMIAVGFFYTLAARLLTALTVTAVMLPLATSRLGWTDGQCLILAVSSALLGFVWTLARDRVERRWTGWRRTVANATARIAVLAGWGFGTGLLFQAGRPLLYADAVLVPLAIWLAWRRLSASGAFAHEVDVERDAYAACVRWILMEAGEVVNPPSTKRPLLFPKSGRLFRRREARQRVAELWLRATLRDPSMVRSLLVLTGAGSAAVWLSPAWLAVIAWVGMVALTILWLHGQWNQWVTERYIALFDWRDETLHKGEESGRMGIGLPIAAFWGLLVGLRFGIQHGGYGWLAAIAAPAAGWAIAWFANARATDWYGMRARVKAQLEAARRTKEAEAHEAG
ncbi:ABC transporter permease [Cohnella nanjingensis]|uniref:ABC transporter permease n=1 Tax=Cohnella nanjingensis TaxID=1387779 RepID=A0A7X0RVJ0_9BACL|nr:ABC transporter permease [Cohnella nanjingensis]MBB6673261.1 ABC transporter permease [Cohnella nanjingensis]